MRASTNERLSGCIEDYALVSDSHMAALVGRDGAVDWMCLPRFDSPACFAALLADEQDGTWRITPAGGGVAARRRYRGDTLVLETEWDTPDGTVRLVDCMPPHRDTTRLVRVVEGLTGRVSMRILLRPRFRPRFDYVDLLSEQYDVTAGRQLGNTPHTASMVALINTARLLTTNSPVSALAGQASAPHSR